MFTSSVGEPPRKTIPKRPMYDTTACFGLLPSMMPGVRWLCSSLVSGWTLRDLGGLRHANHQKYIPLMSIYST